MFIAVLLIKCGSENDVLLICCNFAIDSIFCLMVQRLNYFLISSWPLNPMCVRM